MIVTDTEHGWRCVTQPDHASLSSEILSLWRSDGLPSHPRRTQLLVAVREHDNGWREADSAPRFDTSAGRPYDFSSLPAPARLQVWRRGLGRYRESDPYVAAMIAEHARYLHEGNTKSRQRDDPGASVREGPGLREEEWDEFLAGLETVRRDALAEAELDLEALLEDYRWLHLADLISLAACAGWRQNFSRWHLNGRWDGETLRLEPFPLAGATAFSVPCRHLERADFKSDAAMATALATCRWQRFSFRIAP